MNKNPKFKLEINSEKKKYIYEQNQQQEVFSFNY